MLLQSLRRFDSRKQIHSLRGSNEADVFSISRCQCMSHLGVKRISLYSSGRLARIPVWPVMNDESCCFDA